jgi:hypothetical protein
VASPLARRLQSQRSILHLRDGARTQYRDLPKFVLRRIDRMAGEVNAFLVVAAIGLAMLDLAYLAQKLAESLPPTIFSTAQMR